MCKSGKTPTSRRRLPNMPATRLYPLASGTGFATVLHGNIVILTTRSSQFDASVQAFTTDSNTQYRTFDTPGEAVRWAAETAATHQGRPNQHSTIRYWEVREGHSITVSRTPEGGYKPGRHPIWVDSDHLPVMGLRETFPTQEEALEWVRDVVGKECRQEDQHQQKLLRIREAIESLTP